MTGENPQDPKVKLSLVIVKAKNYVLRHTFSVTTNNSVEPLISIFSVYKSHEQWKETPKSVTIPRVKVTSCRNKAKASILDNVWWSQNTCSLTRQRCPQKNQKGHQKSMLKAFKKNNHKQGRSLVDITHVFLWNLKILLLLFLSTSQPLNSAQSQQRQSHSPGVTGRTANLAKQKQFHVWREKNRWKWLYSLDILQHNILITPYYTYETGNLSSQQHLKEIWDSSLSSTIPSKSHIKENIVAGAIL